MEVLTETGKRVERLLYSSVIIIIASFLFYYLSEAISSDKNSLKKTLLLNFIEVINRNQKSLELAKDLQESYDRFQKENKNKTEKQLREEKEKERIEIVKLNKARLKLGMAEINVDKRIDEKPSPYTELNINNINSVRNKLNLTEHVSIEGAKDVYNEAYRLMVRKIFYNDNDLQKEFIKKEQSAIKDLIDSAKIKINELDKGSVKVFDVDTPLQIPFSLGDLKSNLSLYNIETVGMIFMPVLLVIWLGSISMTRAREIYYIKKSKRISETYPHILNLYYFIDRDLLEKQSDIDEFDQLISGDRDVIKSKRSSSYIYFIVRVIMLVAFTATILTPFYVGAYKVSGSLSVINVIGLCICFFINVIQAISFVVYEVNLSKTIFTVKGDVYEIK